MDIRTRLTSHKQFLDDLVLKHSTGLRDILIHLLATHNIDKSLANQALNVLDAIDFFSDDLPKNELTKVFWSFDGVLSRFKEDIRLKNIVTFLNHMCLELYAFEGTTETKLADCLEDLIKREVFKHLLDKGLMTEEQLKAITLSIALDSSMLDFNYDDVDFTDEQALYPLFRYLRPNFINPDADRLIEELTVDRRVITNNRNKGIDLIKRFDDDALTGPTRGRYKSLENYLNFNKGLSVVLPHNDQSNAATVLELLEVDEPKHQAAYRTLDAIIDQIIELGFLPTDDRTKSVINPFTGDTLTVHPHYIINRAAVINIPEDHVFSEKITETNGGNGLHIAEVDNKPLVIYNIDRKLEPVLLYNPDALSIATLKKEVNP